MINRLISVFLLLLLSVGGVPSLSLVLFPNANEGLCLRLHHRRLRFRLQVRFPPPASPSSPTAPRTATTTKSLAELQNRIAEILRKPELAPAMVAVKVASLDTGRVLFEENAHKLVRPASNMKLYTIAAALDRLMSADFRFTTSIQARLNLTLMESFMAISRFMVAVIPRLRRASTMVTTTKGSMIWQAGSRRPASSVLKATSSATNPISPVRNMALVGNGKI